MIEKLRPLFGMDSKLQDIPTYWLREIEPKIIRKGMCWIWQGAHDKNGEPVMALLNPKTNKYNTRLVKRVVAALFWELKKFYDVVHLCGNLSCLNPAHFYVSRTHWSQEDREKMVKAKQKNIRDYEARGR